MITYVPFLKFKGGEVNAIGSMDPAALAHIAPFFDMPKKKDLTAAEFKETVKRMAGAITRHMGGLTELYFDNYDISDNLLIGAEQNYAYLLRKLGNNPIIPVLGIDRTKARIDAVAKLKDDGVIKSAWVALRITEDDFESYAAVQDELDEVGPVLTRFNAVDLVFDLRIFKGNPEKTGKAIVAFSEKFCAEYDVRRVIVTGSSIPASISDVLKVKSECSIDRAELAVFDRVRSKHAHATLVFGDYTVISPDYSDVDLPPEIMQNVTTSKFIYTLKGRHFFIRGERVRGNYEQYFELAKRLCAKAFYRGPAFSWGDNYLNEKSQGLGSNCGPSTVVKPTVNAHIAYMISVLPF